MMHVAVSRWYTQVSSTVTAVLGMSSTPRVSTWAPRPWGAEAIVRGTHAVRSGALFRFIVLFVQSLLCQASGPVD